MRSACIFAIAASAVLPGLLGACPADTSHPAADTAVSDTADAVTAADTAEPLDTQPGDTGAPDGADAADTAEPLDTSPADTVGPATVPLTCSVPADCLAACATGLCQGDRCAFPAPQLGCVVPDLATDTGACVAAGAVDPASACLFCNPAVQADGYTSMVLVNDFDGGQSGMSIEKLSDTVVTWSVTSHRAANGTSSLYFGDPSRASYGVGARAAGRATTAPIDGPPGAPLTLSFELWLETEETAGFDHLRVLVDRGAGQPVEVWSSDAIGGTTYGEFLPVVIDLAAVTAPGMRVVFEFDSVDDIINDFEGAYVDALRLSTGCCASDAHCTDADACTADRCGADGRCGFEPIDGCCLLDGDCDDGDLCTRDVCATSGGRTSGAADTGARPYGAAGTGGQCSFPAIFDCCHAKSDCDDGDPCTEDLCPGAGELCQHQPLCCEQDSDCDDGDACTIGSCSGNQCGYVFACCAGAADCDDGDACTADSCVAPLCHHDFTFVPGCCRPDVLTQRFDGGSPGGWGFSTASANVGWRVLEFAAEAQSGSGVLYYGHPTLHYYDNGAANHGTATSANVRLPDGVEVRLTMRVKLDVEPSLFKDIFQLDALVGATTVPLVTKADVPLGGWQTVSVDLSYLAGQNVRLRFSFDTVDGLANGTEGVLIDDLRILSSCHPRPCQSDASCPSPVQCISGSCHNDGCVYGGGC